jgi:hypothetical protein
MEFLIFFLVGKWFFLASLIRLVYIYLFLDCRMEIVCSTHLFISSTDSS